MIKVESKGNSIKAEVTGGGLTILSELAYVASNIHEAIEKAKGKEMADKGIKMAFEMALMSEEELDKECEAKKQLLKESAREFLDDLLTPGGAK